MSILSTDTLYIVFSFLELKDILTCRLVNNQFCDIINSDYMWLQLCKKNYGLYYQKLIQETPEKTYEMCYALCYALSILKRDLKIHWLNLNEIYKLKKLELPEKKLTELPKQIRYLTNLQELNLYQNNLSCLPKEIGKLTNLECLSLTCNNLKTIPTEVSQLVNLKMLQIEGNKLRTLPPEIRSLKHLTILTDVAIQFYPNY